MEFIASDADRGRLLQHPAFQVAVPFLQFLVLLLHQRRQPLVFRDEAALTDRIPDSMYHIFIIPWFADIAERPPLIDGIDGRIYVRIAGQHDPEGVRRDFP